MRSRNMGHVYREVHSDDITTLAFHNAPGRQRILLSGSTDGLFSATDTSIADEDDAVLGVGCVLRIRPFCARSPSEISILFFSCMQTSGSDSQERGLDVSDRSPKQRSVTKS